MPQRVPSRRRITKQYVDSTSLSSTHGFGGLNNTHEMTKAAR